MKRSLCRVRRRFLGMGGRCICVWDGHREGKMMMILVLRLYVTSQGAFRREGKGREGRNGRVALAFALAISLFFTVTDNTPPVGWLMMMCEACMVLFCVYIYECILSGGRISIETYILRRILHNQHIVLAKALITFTQTTSEPMQRQLVKQTSNSCIKKPLCITPSTPK